MKFLIICTILLLSTPSNGYGSKPWVSPKQINLGQVHSITKVVFYLHNDTPEPLVVTKVESSCGCTKLEYQRSPIAVSDSTKFSLKYTPQNDEIGVFYKTIKIFTSATSEPVSVVVRGTNKPSRKE